MLDILTKIIAWMLRKCDFVLVVRRKGDGYFVINGDDEGRKHLEAITMCAIRNGYVGAKEYILDTAAEYLKPLEIESKEFIERIK